MGLTGLVWVGRGLVGLVVDVALLAIDGIVASNTLGGSVLVVLVMVVLVDFELGGLDFDFGGRGGEEGCTVSDCAGTSDLALS